MSIRGERRFDSESSQEHTKSGAIKPALEVYEINENTPKKIEESKASEKIFNLLKGIEKAVLEQAANSPYLISIGEKAEEIARQFRERQLTTQRVLEELKRIVEEITTAQKEQSEKNLPIEVFATMWLFKKEGIPNAEETAAQMKEVFEEYPHWKTSGEHERKIRNKLYAILVKAGFAERVTDIGKKIMQILTGRVR